ncbi:MAG: 3-dehydroquinate synthase [Rhodospirillaceae bacterium]|nr:3-dehydroquinate synthase [Rhodospirillaceae bacterium]
MMKSEEIIPVNLGDRSYEICVGSGILETIGVSLLKTFGVRKIFIVTDHEVATHWLGLVVASIKKVGLKYEVASIPSGESSKSFNQLEGLLNQFFEARIARDGLIVALGGGVVGDLAGFAAAVALRGVDFVQVPTTLLAQVDSSVGGKTAINTAQGKNLVGSFYQPRLVLIDTDVLDTLPQRQILSGYAEIVKYGLIKNRQFFEWLEVNGKKILSGDTEARRTAIVESCKTKAAIVGDDEKETGERAILNFGHTFGHAFEAEAKFNGDLLHGEAVALGMMAALKLSKITGICNGQEVDRVNFHLQSVGLPVNLRSLDKFSGWNVDALVKHIGHDKKVLDGKIRYILLKEIGNSFITSEVDPNNVSAVISQSLEGRL